MNSFPRQHHQPISKSKAVTMANHQLPLLSLNTINNAIYAAFGRENIQTQKKKLLQSILAQHAFTSALNYLQLIIIPTVISKWHISHSVHTFSSLTEYLFP